MKAVEGNILLHGFFIELDSGRVYASQKGAEIKNHQGEV
jgi:hypothetical protein